jgi:hypothetical protein
MFHQRFFVDAPVVCPSFYDLKQPGQILFNRFAVYCTKKSIPKTKVTDKPNGTPKRRQIAASDGCFDYWVQIARESASSRPFAWVS